MQPALCLFAVAAATAAVTAEKVTQRTVFPHGENKCDEYGRATAGKHAFKPVICTARRYEQQNEYPKAAVAAAKLRKNIHIFPPVNALQGDMYKI